MIHLRLIVPSPLTDQILDRLCATTGVAHVVRAGTAVLPAGDVLQVDVARESADDVVEWLQDLDVHRDGAIVIDGLDAVVSDAAARASTEAPGHGAEALIWEEVEARAREESVPDASYLVFMVVAAIIAATGILLDSPILIVGAMVVGPEYGPLAATCVGLARWRVRPARRAFGTLVAGLAVAGLAALLATIAFRATGLAPDQYDVSDRELTAFIAHPDGLAAVVAVVAGVAGMLALTQTRAGALVGVLVSVTTIPAVANIGAATAFRAWDQVGGAAAQLGINLAGLLLAGVITLAVQNRLTHRSAPSWTALGELGGERH